jgi:hypothetical protein
MNANKGSSSREERRSGSLPQNPSLTGQQLTHIRAQSIRVHSRPFAVAMILLSAVMLAQPATAGPFDALKNFFVRPQPQAHVTHHRPHPKEAKDAPKDAPNDSPSPVAPPVDQQTNQQQNGAPGQQNTGQQNTLNNNNRPGRPALASAPLF